MSVQINIPYDNRNALLVTGGGARGAYQIGVLRAVSEIIGPQAAPFRIFSGISVGALNASALAAGSEDFSAAVKQAEDFWKSLTLNAVFDSRLHRIVITSLKLVFAAIMPRVKARPPKSLLDVSPLRKALSENIDFNAIAAAIDAGRLHAVCVTCSGYDSGYAVTFFDSLQEGLIWHRVRREGRRRRIGLSEIMASSALPMLFPAIKIDNQYYGDGALRQTAPLAPAIHLGADRLFVIGTRDSDPPPFEPCGGSCEYPSVGDIGGYALDTIFHDSLEADMERLERINTMAEILTKSERAETKIRPLKVLAINPSKSLRSIANSYSYEMPGHLRKLIRRRAAEHSLGRIESYLLFEQGYINALLDLGYQDGMAKHAEIIEFFGGSAEAAKPRKKPKTRNPAKS